MKFNIEKIILWLNNGKKRELEFKPNKVNVITGDSTTGKTAILDIIDYCFFAGKSTISESVINENISWYGLLININDKKYTIARKSLFEARASNEYFFSSTGEVPERNPEGNNVESSIKSILETEFSIDKNVSIGFGSNFLKVGSKISLRFFLMFNTISQDIITNSKGIFFDKQNETRYRDALPRIFDIATGIEKIDNILRKEKKFELEKKLIKLKRKESDISKKSEYFKKEQKALLKKAKEFLLINPDTSEEKALDELKEVVKGVQLKTEPGNEKEVLEKQRNIIKRKIRNLKNFISEYSIFKTNLIEIEDSLKPINFIKSNSKNLIRTDVFDSLLSQLSDDLRAIKVARKAKTPINKQVNDEIEELTKKLEEISEKLELFPSVNRGFENDKDKYFFLGEVKSKLHLYSKSESSPIMVTKKEIRELEEEIESIVINNTDSKRELTIKLIEELIRDYMVIVEKSLENYKDYLPVFEYKEKALSLRKPKATFLENVGSSSNHMFLHLFFSLAIQEVIFKNESPFVAPFLVIDQPSRPYYGDDGNRKTGDAHKSDTYKISKVFKLLNDFIEKRKHNNGEFQMIVFEHIPPEVFKDMEHICLVDKEFRSGNALIPDNMIN